MVLEDLSGGLVFHSFSRSPMIDEATHLLIKVMVRLLRDENAHDLCLQLSDHLYLCFLT
jgi:hypothetical protein